MVRAVDLTIVVIHVGPQRSIMYGCRVPVTEIRMGRSCIEEEVESRRKWEGREIYKVTGSRSMHGGRWGCVNGHRRDGMSRGERQIVRIRSLEQSLALIFIHQYSRHFPGSRAHPQILLEGNHQVRRFPQVSHSRSKHLEMIVPSFQRYPDSM